ncbi:MAG: hypothetical protein CMI76_02090 [Candidatus Pelagibacter sp.]|nr:hypothetical protein [Candidatus Pelagibacter sp.]|tara:strand:- start:8507 stop:9751 length:1245 start_codon:yes stop_codon:yes gene_type:complete
MKKLNLSLLISTFFLLTILARLIAAYFFADTRLDNEWGKLVHNLEFSGILGINVVIDEFTAIHKFANSKDVVLPSAFMPPLYGYFIYYVKVLLANSFDLIKVIIFIQIILSLTSIYLFFKITRKFENLYFSLGLSFLFSFFPMYVYSSVQISSIILQIFLLLCFFHFLLIFIENKKILNLIYFSIFSGLLILVRGEFILFYLITLAYFFLYHNKNFKALFLSLIIATIILSPYLKRNYNYFDTIVLTKSFGHNILKGNNPDLKVEGSGKYISNQKDLKIKTNNYYEIELDNYYRNEAFKNIKENPKIYLILYFKKVFSFLFFDLNSTYPGYYSIFHILPKIVLSILSFCGAIVVLRKKSFFQFLSIYYFSNILLFSIFFILPRYSLILLPIQLLLSVQFIKIILKKLNFKNEII